MRVELVPFRPEFAKPFFDWRHEAHAVRHNPFRKMSFDEVAKMLTTESSDLALYGKAESFRWFVLADGILAGNFSLKNISLMMATGEIGYGVAESLHGKGIGTEAVRLGVAKIFESSPIRRLIAYVDVANEPSCRLLSKLGFVREGVLRQHYLINGKPADEALYGILKGELKI